MILCVVLQMSSCTSLFLFEAVYIEQMCRKSHQTPAYPCFSISITPVGLTDTHFNIVSQFDLMRDVQHQRHYAPRNIFAKHLNLHASLDIQE